LPDSEGFRELLRSHDHLCFESRLKERLECFVGNIEGDKIGDYHVVCHYVVKGREDIAEFIAVGISSLNIDKDLNNLVIDIVKSDKPAEKEIAYRQFFNVIGNKSNHIRDKIIKKLDVCPKFREAMKTAYRRQIRNAESHSQYQVIQGGIWFDNYKKVNADEVQGIGFEEWEKIYCYTYLIFRGIFDNLKSIVQQLYIPATMITRTGGIPILCYYHNGTWGESCIYPDKTGNTWRFHKQL